MAFTLRGKTHKIEANEAEQVEAKSKVLGDVSIQAERPVTFECNGKQLTACVVDSIVVGRQSKIPGDMQPDVALNEFGAEERGVSRQHLRLVRKQDLIYASDLGSSNGTFLNGRPLMRNSLRVLRNGDELQLGTLRMTVVF
jgi:pSer/pThr/pTyr-binding forkhead associated (FHA) protein